MRNLIIIFTVSPTIHTNRHENGALEFRKRSSKRGKTNLNLKTIWKRTELFENDVVMTSDLPDRVFLKQIRKKAVIVAFSNPSGV